MGEQWRDAHNFRLQRIVVVFADRPVKRSVSGTDSVTSLPPQWDLTDMDGDFQLVKVRNTVNSGILKQLVDSF